MIDPLLALAFAVHSNKGVYALLLGSGVSRSAGIPTGWEVVEDLIRKLAVLKGEQCEPDPAAWYRATFGEDPDYSTLLDNIARSPAERSQLLRSYFEPTEDEVERGLKVPSQAHKAIAELVVGGYVRVIVTVNFDRLIETALEAAGVTPTVISTPDAAVGAVPLMHARCTVIKLHGDYLDSRIKNTAKELASYDKRIDRLLDEILDQFGLVVSGWSAEWDHALRAAVERCKSRRYTTFWTVKGDVGEAAKRLIDLRRAEVIPTEDADSFFGAVAEKVAALEDVARPHPLSPKVAVATLKRYLENPGQRIRLHDFMMDEVERVLAQSSDRLLSPHDEYSDEELQRRVRKYEAAVESLLTLMATGCSWETGENEGVWVKCLQRLGDPEGPRAGKEIWLNLRYYPLLLATYAAGIAALNSRRYVVARRLLTETRVRIRDEDHVLAEQLNTWSVMDGRAAKTLPGLELHYTALSEHLFEVLRDPLRETVARQADFEESFDCFEYLLALVYSDLKAAKEYIRAPLGSFAWRHHYEPQRSVIHKLDRDIKGLGPDLPLLQAGFFGGSLDRLSAAKGRVDQLVHASSWR